MARRGAQGDRVLYLPVAPQVTARTRFSSSLPGKISYLMPAEALDYLVRASEDAGRIDLIAISGPGDPLATPDTTMKTLELVRSRFPDMVLAVKTLGIGAERFAAELAAAGVTRVEMEVNTVTSETIEKLYAWIRPGQKTLKIDEAAQLLIREQKNGVPALKFHDMSVSVTTTLYPGINDQQIGRISRTMMELGADSISIKAYKPEPDSEVVLDTPGRAAVVKAKEAAGKYLSVVEPLLLQGEGSTGVENDISVKSTRPQPTSARPNVAVMSSNGIDVDLHLGKSKKILIYGPRPDGLACLLGTRPAPPSGNGAARWRRLAATLADCFVVLAAQAGEAPRSILLEHGLSVIVNDDQIDGLVDALYGGTRKAKKKNRKKTLSGD